MPMVTNVISSTLADLRGTSWQGTQYLAVIPRNMRVENEGGSNVLKSSTLVSDGMVLGFPFGFGTTGVLASGSAIPDSVKRGHTVLIHYANVEQPIMTMRVRNDKVDTPIPVNSIDLNYHNVSSYFGGGDYTGTIKDDFMIRDRLPRFSGGVQFKDYDIAFHEPDPIIYDLQGAYVAYTTSATATITFEPEARKGVPSIATIFNWSWDAVDGTFVFGTSSTDKDVSIEFEPGFRWVQVEATFPATGRTGRRYIPVWVYHPTLFPPMQGFNGATITGNIDDGYSATIEVFNTDDVLIDGLFERGQQPRDWWENMLVVIWSIQDYNGTTKNFNTNIDFVGRVRTTVNGLRVDAQHATITNPAQLEVEGIGAQLRATPAYNIVISDTATTATAATEWDQIQSNNVYRTVGHYLATMTTVMDTVSVDFVELPTTSMNSDYRIGEPRQIADGDVFSSMNTLLDTIGGKLQFSPQGEIFVARDTRMRPELFNTVTPVFPTAATFDDRDLFEFTLNRNHRDSVRVVLVAGGLWNSASGTNDVAQERWPGVPRSGLTQVSKTNAIFREGENVQSEAQRLAFLLYCRDNGRYRLQVTFPDGYHYLTPYVGATYQFDLGTTLNESDYIIDSNFEWILESISHTHDNQTGTRNVTATFIDARVRNYTLG